jgi:hypothetical protein
VIVKLISRTRKNFYENYLQFGRTPSKITPNSLVGLKRLTVSFLTVGKLLSCPWSPYVLGRRCSRLLKIYQIFCTFKKLESEKVCGNTLICYLSLNNNQIALCEKDTI